MPRRWQSPKKWIQQRPRRKKDTFHPGEANNPINGSVGANAASHSIGVAFFVLLRAGTIKESISTELREDSNVSVKKPRLPFNGVK